MGTNADGLTERDFAFSSPGDPLPTINVELAALRTALAAAAQALDMPGPLYGIDFDGDLPAQAEQLETLLTTLQVALRGVEDALAAAVARAARRRTPTSSD
jgi:hypothetical protein